MGTKGRDIVFWLFVLFLAGAALIKSKSLFWAASGDACLLAVYYRLYVPLAIKQSRVMGLKTVVLLPLWPTFAGLYKYLTGGDSLYGSWGRAYEIHILNNEPDKFLKKVEDDLMMINSTMSGVFYWETSAPVPAAFRRLIRQKILEGRAFWRKGTWPIPRMPGAAREIVKKHCRCGAIILEERQAKAKYE